MKNIPFTESELREIRNHFNQELEKLEKQADEIRSMLNKFSPSKQAEISEKIQTKEKTDVVVKSKRGRGRKKAEVVTGVVAPETAVVAEVKTESKRKPGKRKVKQTAEKLPRRSKKLSAVAETEVSVDSGTKKKRVSKNKGAGKTVKSKKEQVSRKPNWAGFILDLLESNNQLLPSKAFVDAAMKRDNLSTNDEFIKTRGLVATKLSDMVNKSKTLVTFAQQGKKGSLYGLPEWFDETGNLVDAARLVG